MQQRLHKQQNDDETTDRSIKDVTLRLMNRFDYGNVDSTNNLIGAQEQCWVSLTPLRTQNILLHQRFPTVDRLAEAVTKP